VATVGANYLPQMTRALSEGEFGDVFSAVTATGIYANLRLSDDWLIRAVAGAADFAGVYGTQNAPSEHTFVVDYSSPNVAKRLHAGHIRSTIIGHILSNLYDASGATVYRVNHINDFGGFGYTLQGYRQFAELFPAELGANDLLIEIYQIRRALERVAGSGLDAADYPYRRIRRGTEGSSSVRRGSGIVAVAAVVLGLAGCGAAAPAAAPPVT